MHFEFPWLKDLCKVIAIRLRRPTKNRRKRGLTDTDHEGDGSIPAGIPIAPPSPSPTLPSNPSSSDPISVSAPRDPCLEVSANISSSKYSVSLAREASDMAQFALPFVQAFAGVIPLVGAPTKAAIGGLLEVLQAIDRRDQNKADLDSLKLRLHQLGHHLCNAPPPRDPLEQSRRDSIVRVLEETSAQLTKLHKCRRLVYASVTQVIARCSTAIDRYLLECLWTSQMQSQNDIREMKDLIIRTQFSVGPSPMQSIGTFALSCVTLVDATGHEHPVSVNFSTSFQQLNDMLQVLFKRESIEARIQRRYIEEGHYYLCIDEGTEVTRLTSDEWSTIEAGTKIVMRVIIEQQMTSSLGVSYKCHFCDAENHLGLGSIMYSLRRRAGCSIDCRECKRRFQISRKYLSAMESSQCSNIDSNHTTDPEMLVIRNFHVQQIVTAHDLSRAAYRKTDGATAMSRSQRDDWKLYESESENYDGERRELEKLELKKLRETLPGLVPRPALPVTGSPTAIPHSQTTVPGLVSRPAFLITDGTAAMSLSQELERLLPLLELPELERERKRENYWMEMMTKTVPGPASRPAFPNTDGGTAMSRSQDEGDLLRSADHVQAMSPLPSHVLPSYHEYSGIEIEGGEDMEYSDEEYSDDSEE